MKRQVSNTGKVKEAILEAIADGDATPTRAIARRFSITRQAVNRHLRQLVETQAVQAVGSTRARKYELVETKSSELFPLSALDEDRVWRAFAVPKITGIPVNIHRICHHGVTEMVNNAIDHSEGTAVTLDIIRTAAFVRISVNDDGVGIFSKVQHAAALEDEKLAALELAKGKFTTDPQNHSGEGIFFTSRMFDSFSILSHRLFLLHQAENNDWLIEDEKDAGPGTRVSMNISLSSIRTVQGTFDRFASPEDYAFKLTHVPVSLARIGSENLVSRSQAKRLLARLDRFDHVILDFEGVESIGQAFADEVFRVFARNNPGTTLESFRATPQIGRMIRRARAGAMATPPYEENHPKLPGFE